MKLKYLLGAGGLVMACSLTAQNVAINNTGATANTNAILDVDVSTNDKGLLIPRLTTAQRTAIAGLGAADEGLTVYDETTNSFWFWDGTQWLQMQNSGSGWLLTGNAGTSPATNFVGTTDNQSLVFRTNNTERMRILNTGNIGVGVSNPAYGLEIQGTFGFGNGTSGSYRSRTETRDDAGLIATQSGFFETVNPSNYPAGASSWWHLIDVRHSNNTNNYALQISGSFFDQELWFRKTNNNGAQAWARLLSTSNLNNLAWSLLGNSGTNAAANFIGTTDAVDFVTRTSNTERMRVTSAGNVGIGIAVPTQRLDVQGGNARINNVFIGDVGHGPTWAGLSHSGQNTTTGYGFLQSSDGAYTLINKQNTGSGYIGFRVANADYAAITNGGFMGIGTTTPQAKLQVVNGAIMPHTGNNNTSGIYFPPNPGGGGGDEAFIRHYVEAGENTKLVIANVNDFDDDISLRTGNNLERIQVNGNGTIYLNRGVFFDCNDCGGTANGQYDMTDGAGGNWGDMSIQGRVISANSNIHLSPPGGSRVIINSSYRAAGGGTGTTGLDIEDGGIRMRKNYAYIQRYRYCNCFGAGSPGNISLGNWDFCAVAHVGFKNNQSTTDEDDDVQCAVFPNGAGSGEQTQYDYYYTEQFNSRRQWIMYLEAYEDTNGVTCAATCMNFE